MVNYQDLTDEEVVNLYHSGELDAMDYLVRKYTPLIYKCHNNRYAHGFSRDDFIQEGFIGLMNAINKYDYSSEASFYTFARTCIDNSMNKLLEKSRLKKHQILNNSQSLEETEDTSDVVGDDPANIVLQKMMNRDVLVEVEAKLSAVEKKVYSLLLDGYNSKEIASILGRDSKSIDNTIQRIKKKARRIS